MKFFKSIEQVVAGGTFTGAAPGTALTEPTGADGSNHILYHFATAVVGGLFDPAQAITGAAPARARKLTRLSIKLGASVAWTLDILDQDGGTRLANAFAATSQYYMAAGDDGPVLLPGETIVFKAATTGTVVITFAEDA